MAGRLKQQVAEHSQWLRDNCARQVSPAAARTEAVDVTYSGR